MISFFPPPSSSQYNKKKKDISFVYALSQAFETFKKSYKHKDTIGILINIYTKAKQCIRKKIALQ